MKIAIVGCGALGSYYGACLTRAGHDVHFLLRSDLETVRTHGVQVLSPDGDFHVRPNAAATPEEIGPCDLVVIGLKTTANGEFPRLIPPLVEIGTAVLTLQNGLGNEEALSTVLREDQILGGLCFVCINRIAPGIIRHIAHGRIMLGEYGRPADDRTRMIASAFEAAGVPCEVTDTLAEAHWLKLVWNIPFNGLGVASAAGLEALETGRIPDGRPLAPCNSSDQLLADPAWESWVRRLMAEVIATARAQGHAVPDDYAQYQIDRTREMGPYFASTIVDFMDQRPLELDSLFLEPLRQAQEFGVATPALAALCGVLGDLARVRA
jgi:2-dehydropantoate 2-reductase